MVPAILILTFAWSLKAMTDSLGAKYFVADFVYNYATGLQMFLPAIVFLIGCLLAFATGTSWGTFGVLIPITMAIFPLDDPMGIVCIAACMAGAVCGDIVRRSPTQRSWPLRAPSATMSSMSPHNCPMQ